MSSRGGSREEDALNVAGRLPLAALAEILWEVAQGGPASRELTLEEMDAAARVVLGQMPMVDRAQRLAGLQRRGLGILGCILGGSAGGSEPAMQPVETEASAGRHVVACEST